MEYYFSKIIKSDFDGAIAKVIEALKSQGFGIVTEIDMQAKLKEKLGVDYKKYKILGACNPSYAYKALMAEEKIGVMLPCNFIFIDKENGNTEVTAINPIASMMAIQNPELEPMAHDLTKKLESIIGSLN